MSLYLHTASFYFSQDGDGNDSAPQKLRVDVESCGAGPYLIVNTQRWAIDQPHELIDVLVRAHQAAVPLFEHFSGRDDSF